MDSYLKSFENTLTKVVFDMMRLKNKALLPVGLEINSMNINLCTDTNFKLKGYTFAYYCPIDDSININIEDPFFKNCTTESIRNAKLFFVLFHEAMHKILMHIPERLNNRNSTLWNIAADYEIHNMYYIYSKNDVYQDEDKVILKDYFDYIDRLLIAKEFPESPETPRFLFSDKFLENIAEEIYEVIMNSKQTSEQMMDIEFNIGNGNEQDDQNGNSDENDENQKKKKSGSVKCKVRVTEYKLPDGDTHKEVEIEWPKNSQLPENLKKDDKEQENEQQRRACNRSLLENTFTQMSKTKGDHTSTCSKFLKKLFHIKIDWVKILRNSLQTILEKSDYFAWNNVRTSTFLLPNMPYLPAIVEDQNKYGTLIISCDESGSMSDDDIAKAANIIIEAKAHYKKIVVIKHDTEISKTYEFEELNDDTIKSLFTREHCGGTSHKAVFEFLRDYQKKHRDDKISCYIGITDMESDIEHCQDIIPGDVPVIYLTPINYERDWSDIKGKVIPIEK